MVANKQVYLEVPYWVADEDNIEVMKVVQEQGEVSELAPVMLMVIVKVAVGVIDVIEMEVDEQVELGIYQVLD